MFKQDWMERQIEAIGSAFAAIVFGKEKVKKIFDNYEEEATDTTIDDELLEITLKKYVSEGKINEAEDILFDAIENKRTPENLLIALSFYDNLNEFDEEKLVSCDFSKQEIIDGIKHLRKLYDEDCK